jgi:selenocysteine-specific elongation factor
LRAAIDQLAARLGPRQSTRHPRLPIDRCFTLKGHGTVVTGTLRDAPLRTDTELAVYPTSRLTRVRSLQTHNSSAPQAEPGARVAINLTGLEVSELARGQVLAPPHVYRSTRLLDAQIEILASSKPIKDRAPVHFHSAAMETEAELRLLSREKSLAPGGQAFVRLALREEHLLLPGDRFILRSFSPVHTIAGGTVLDIHFSPQRLKRLGQADRLAAWSKLSVAERSRLLVEAESLGIAQPEVCLRLAASPADLDPGLLQTPDHWLIAPARLAALDQSLAARLARHHHEKPLEPGLSRESLRSELLAAAPPSLLDLILSQSQSLAAHGEFLRLKSHRVQMAAPEDAAAKKIEAAFRDAGLAVPNLEDVLKATALPAPQSKAVLSHLLRGGQLVRVSPELVFHRDAISQLKSLLAPKKGHRFSVADFKDWTGISRKYAIPLLEFLDREKSTRRDGDQRIVL